MSKWRHMHCDIFSQEKIFQCWCSMTHHYVLTIDHNHIGIKNHHLYVAFTVVEQPISLVWY